MVIVRSFNRLSKIFQPFYAIPKDAKLKPQDLTSKSQRLMIELGVIRQANPGCFHLLPLGVRSLEKLSYLVDEEMQKIGGQKVIFPTLTNSKLWKITGRLDAVSAELFQLQDRHGQNYILSPTHEEAATELFNSISPISYKQLPLKLYQITNKYRDEMKPRFGLMRGKQFLMKDMYSFDIDVESSKKTYEQITNTYDIIFKKIGIDFVKVLGISGDMGGDFSHEYHYKAEIGEDKILSCLKCNYAANVEVIGEVVNTCPQCKNKSVEISNGIEIGHTFFLGEKYSKPLKATYLGQNSKPKTVQMGSYGLGLSRIMAATVEVLSNEQEIRWPDILAPYNIVIIPPKKGSKEETHLGDLSGKIETLYEEIESLGDSLKNNILIDDRDALTIGRRYFEAKRLGYPYIIVLGNKIVEDPPLFELTDLKSSKQMHLDKCELMNYIRNVIRQ